MFILPIAKDNHTRNMPWAVLCLIALNSLVLVVTYFGASPESVFSQYGFTPARPQSLTVVSSLFLHAGFWHLLGNMWFLWMFGNQVENMFGPWVFSILYLGSGLGGTLLHYELNLRSTVPCVGASGAISGIVGAYFILFPKSHFDLDVYLGWYRLKTIPTQTHAAVGAWIGEQTLLGLITRATGASGIAFWAHVGGFGVGALAALIFVLIVPAKERHLRLRAKPWFMQDRYNRDDNHITQLKL